MDWCSPADSGFDRQFDARHAAAKLRDYRRKGATGLTRQLINALAEVDAIVAAHGPVKRRHRETLGWQLSLYERTPRVDGAP